MKKVLIVDDHRGAATGLSMAVQFDGRMTPLGPASTVESALSFVDEADIVVLDLTLIDSEGAETVRRFKAGAPRTCRWLCTPRWTSRPWRRPRRG